MSLYPLFSREKERMLKCQREKFLLQSKYAYLNCAYMAPISKKVEKAGIKGIKRKRKPYQVGPEDFFKSADTCRQLFAELIDSSDTNRIAILPSVSYGIANVTHNLRGKRGEIIVVDEQFPSNIYPWKAIESKDLKVRFISKPEGTEKGALWNESIVAAISDETVAVAIGNVHWADGTLFDLKRIREKTKDHQALLIIDGTQSVGALPISVQQLQPDALICAGYKWLFGPYSIALGYYGPAFDEGQPIEENWINRKGAENFGGLVNYEPAYQPQALRYEVGEHSNFILLPMMVEALKQLLKWSVPKVQEYCQHLTGYLINEIEPIGFRFDSPEFRVGHLIGLRPPQEMDVDKLQIAFKQKKISVSTRGNSIRVSPNVYNDERDIDRLIKTLKEVKQ